MPDKKERPEKCLRAQTERRPAAGVGGGGGGEGGSCSRKQKGEVRASENEAERKLDSLGVIVPIKVQLE